MDKIFDPEKYGMLFCLECNGNGKLLNDSEDIEICPKEKEQHGPSLINDSKAGSDCQLYGMRNVLAKSPLAELPPIYLSIHGVMCAYVLGKMVEMASSTRKRIQFHYFSTLPCGLGTRSLPEQTFLGGNSTHLS
jgi:hypothetical protein